MTINILDLDQVCNIAEKVYFDVIDHFNVYDEMIECNDDEEGSKNTEKGEELYYLIEEAVKSAIDYQDQYDGWESHRQAEIERPMFSED